ncbi:MAG: nuclear transport factor 2 family protein [Acidimicrobiia bacterium]
MDTSVLGKLADNLEINEVLARYARGIDRLDPVMIRACYHDGAVDHHGTFEGPADKFVEWVVTELGRYSMTMHALAQTLIEYDAVSSDVAFAETYALAFHRNPDGRQGDNWITGFRYFDRFERRPVDGGSARWRIAERTVVGEWLSVDPMASHRKFPAGMTVGQRDGTDLVQGR